MLVEAARALDTIEKNPSNWIGDVYQDDLNAAQKAIDTALRPPQERTQTQIILESRQKIADSTKNSAASLKEKTQVKWIQIGSGPADTLEDLMNKLLPENVKTLDPIIDPATRLKLLDEMNRLLDQNDPIFGPQTAQGYKAND